MNPRLACALLFLGALALRVALLHTARFGGDEALFFRIGMDIVEGKAFPLLGTQITDGAGRLPGPAFLVLVALPLLAARAPEAQYLFVEVLGAVTVVVLWHALRRPFGEKNAFFTGLLIAFSPWSALYADRTWNPNVLPLFVALAFLAALRVREQPSSRWWIALLPLLALMPQLHMSAPVAWAGILVLCGKSWTKAPRTYLFIGLFLSALLYLPLLVSELQTGFENTRHIFTETIGTKDRENHPFGFVYVPLYALRFLTLDVSYHELSAYWGGPHEGRCLQALLHGSAARPFNLWRVAALACSVVVAVAAIFTVLRTALRERSLGVFGLAFLAALLVNTALMGLAAKQVFGHYVTNLFPFVVVVWAAFFQAQSAKRSFVIAVVIAIVIAVGGIEATLSVSRNVDGKIGLEVHRKATAVIVDDAVRLGLAQTDPVLLEFRGVTSSRYDWHIFATRAVGVPLQLVPRPQTQAGLMPRRRYALTPLHTPAPHDASDAAGAIDVGHALLWRLR